MNNSNNAALDGNSIKNINRTGTTFTGRSNQSKFYFSGIVAGIFAAVGMALLNLALGSTEMNTPTVIFAKYIVLGVVLGWVLINHRKTLGDNYAFIDGIRQGGLVTITAAISLALITVFLFSPETSLQTESQSYLSSAFIAGGVRLMECLVLGMILTFIFLQFLKRGRPGEQKLTGNSVQ